MLKRTLYIASTFAIALLLSIVNRGVFVIYNLEFVSQYSLWELAQCFFYGLQLDCSIAGYITIIPLLFAIVSLWLFGKGGSERVWRIVHGVYFATIVLLISTIEVADIGMYGAWLSRIDAQVLIYTPKEMLSSLSFANFVVGACYVGATTIIATWLYLKVVNKFFIPQLGDTSSYIRKIGNTVLLLLLGGVLFLVIRGGVTTATANLSKAHFSPEMPLNHIAINPIFSLLDSSTTSYDFGQHEYFSAKEAQTLFSEAMRGNSTSKDNFDGEWLNTKRPNIVLVIMEGMGRTITDACEGDEPVTPCINALKKEGIWFDKLYASSFRTDRGTVATLSGFPAQPTMSIMKFPNKAARLSGIAASLYGAGYSTRFMYGGDANFTDTRAYLYATGFQEVDDESVIKIDGHHSKWGYADDALLDYAAEQILRRIDEQEQPSFETILTLSSHEPFEVPYKRLNDERLNSFAFTDEAVGAFVERLRLSEHWDNMLVILIPDHGTPYPSTIGGTTPLRHHIPMLWLGGAVRESFVFEEYMAQTDLAATLLGQLGIAHDDFLFSRNASLSSVSHFGYWTFYKGWGIIDEHGSTLYDCTTNRAIENQGEEGVVESRINHGKVILQKTFEVIKNL